MSSNAHPTPFDKLSNMPFHAPKFFFKRSQTDVNMQLRWCPQCAWPGQKPHTGEWTCNHKTGSCDQALGGDYKSLYDCQQHCQQRPHPHQHH